MELGRSGGVQGDGTDRTKTQAQMFTRFGLTWHQKVHFSEILEFQCTRNGPQNLPFCPGSLQDTFMIYSSISHQHIFQKDLAKTKILRIENLKIWIMTQAIGWCSKRFVLPARAPANYEKQDQANGFLNLCLGQAPTPISELIHWTSH